MKTKYLIRVAIVFLVSLFFIPLISLATPIHESGQNWGGVLIDPDGNITVFQGEEIISSSRTIIVPMSMSCTPVNTTLSDGTEITHCAGRDYDSLHENWRAKAWTEAVRDGIDVRHYTRAQVVHALFPSIVYEDSGRVYGYSRTTATTGYVKANELLYSMRSYWGTED